ncbi:hypothetical protein Leryth_007398 [Lithospermum erythrorhizon]|uniref:Uncharacterized protein n=1 Tax=Lithospermum erythrorhizon TaxID=34254 RepID=A0AAV3RZ48_LITER|nr:hypothetical protein Leryth_007398 [Lithospermum erythrorhizon]
MEDNSSLKEKLIRRCSTISGQDYHSLAGGDEGCGCKPLGFLLALPFALILLVVALIGAVMWAVMSLLACILPCFAPCIAVIDFVLELALGMIAAPVFVIIIIMAAMPC